MRKRGITITLQDIDHMELDIFLNQFMDVRNQEQNAYKEFQNEEESPDVEMINKTIDEKWTGTEPKKTRKSRK